MKPIMDAGQLKPGETPTELVPATPDRRSFEVASAEDADYLPKSGELQEVADLADPYFGGFRIAERDHTKCPARPPWKRNPPSAVWGRVWGRVDLTAEHHWKKVVRLQVAPRRWALKDSEETRAACHRWYEELATTERGREWLAFWEAERNEAKEALLAEPMPPPEIGREWFCRPESWPGPTAKIEARRFPKIPALKKLVAPPPKTEVLSAAERRERLDQLVAAYKGPVTVCPPETTTKKPKKRMGRPPIWGRAMTDAERSRRSYRNRVLILKGGRHDGGTGNRNDGGRDRGRMDCGRNRPEPVALQQALRDRDGPF
jgi:hypothetical protein